MDKKEVNKNAIYYLTTDKGIELHNEILDTIRL